MCGIAGIYYHSEQLADPAAIALMTDLQRHRGPDDYGYAFFDRAGQCFWHGRDLQTLPHGGTMALGHRRLSIIDLAETGSQPMSSHEGRYWIVYNGEIYNYVELREELKSLGYRFAGSSDTEVILAAYEQWGAQCVDRFNGMWGLAVWDAREQVLFCSRDRVGIKPFYYYHDDNCFIFASEIKAILAVLPPDQRTVNDPYLARFIVSGLLNDGEDTLFARVNQLLPGHYLQVRHDRIDRRRYWDIPPESIAQANDGQVDENEAAEHFHALLADAIRLQLRADVPLGTCLSGGLDSSTVVALAAKALSSQLNTFTSEYQEPAFSEGAYARAVAATFRTKAYYITPTPEQYIDFIDRFSWYHDEPCPGPGVFSQWHVMKLAGQHVKVVLEGQGADELLAGYYHYFNYYLSSVFKRMFHNGPGRTTYKQFLSDQRAVAEHTHLPLLKAYHATLSHMIRQSLTPGIKASLKPLYRLANRRLGNGLIYDIAKTDLLRQALPAYRHKQRRYHDDLNEILYWELVRDNLPMLLQYGDRTSMAFSIESRVPFLDHRLIEYTSSLSYNLKINSQTTKFILRRAMKHLLPDQVVDRPDKKGFPTPFAVWLKGPLRQYTHDVLHSRAFVTRDLFHPDKVEALLRRHCAGEMDYAWALWRVLNIETWMQIFFDDFKGACQRHLTNGF